MGSRTNIWTGVSRTSSRTEVIPTSEASIRDELIKTIFGSARERAKGSRGIYRRMRLDADGARIPCACADATTGEADVDPPCPYCQSSGFLWDEQWFDYYRTVIGIKSNLAMRENFEPPGVVNVPRIVFYAPYTVRNGRIDPVIIRGHCMDRIIELVRDEEGNLVKPYQRQREYRIGTAIDFRADNGRLEYWEFDCISDNIDQRGLASDL